MTTPPTRKLPRTISTVREARTHNIRLLVAVVGGGTAFANRFGHGRWSQAQVSHWVRDATPKPIGENLARDIEEATGRPRGWLDVMPDPQGASETHPPDDQLIELRELYFNDPTLSDDARALINLIRKHDLNAVTDWAPLLAITKQLLTPHTLQSS